MTLAKKLTGAFALPLVILLVLAALAYWTTAHLISISERVAHTHKVLTGIEELLSTLKDAETGQRGYLLTGEKPYLEPYDNAATDWEKTWAKLRELTANNPEQTQRLDDLKPAIRSKFTELQETIDLRKNQPGDTGFKAALQVVETNKGKQFMDRIREITGAMNNAEHDLLVQRDREAKATTLFAQVALGVGTGVAVLLVLLFGYFLTRSITVPIRAAVNQVASSSAEIAASTNQQAAGAQEQAAAVSQTVTTVDEVTQTATQAAQRAGALGDAVQRTQEVGKAGRAVVEDSITALGKLQGQVESTAEIIVALAEKAQTIGEIIATVGDIAEQSNLLALNAAIEASRAGEQGKGFAVVAGEVKALADQSKKATSQVRQVLGEIQKGTTTAVLSTEEVTKGVVSAARVAAQAGEAIKTLIDTLGQASAVAAQIVAASGQQATGMTQIQQAMQNIDQVARQNLAAMRQAEQAAENLKTLGVRFAHLIGGQR